MHSHRQWKKKNAQLSVQINKHQRDYPKNIHYKNKVEIPARDIDLPTLNKLYPIEVKNHSRDHKSEDQCQYKASRFLRFHLVKHLKIEQKYQLP